MPTADRRSLRVEWEPRDLWVGLYVTWEYWHRSRRLHWYLCLVPCLPLHFAGRRRRYEGRPPHARTRADVGAGRGAEEEERDA